MNCSNPKISKLDAFNKRITEQTAGERYPIQGSIELTERCNNSCVHCYINKPANDRDECQSELSCDEWCRIIDQIVDAGCLYLLLTGGEIFLRPDFLDIYTYAKRKGLLITLFTNGTLLTPRIADYLAEWVPYEIEITLYGMSREVYEHVTGVPGSYERCISGINLLLDRGLPLALKTMVLQSNKHELQAMKSYAEDLGLSFRYDMIINKGFADKKGQPAKQRISPDEVVQFELADQKRIDAWQVAIKREVVIDNDQLYNCGGGVSHFHINAQGKLNICMMSRQPNYDLRQGTFQDGWHQRVPKIIEQKRTVDTECQQCSLQPICNQCPVQSEIEFGDSETRVEYICSITKAQSEALKLNCKE